MARIGGRAAFVFAGGGRLGANQVGMLRVLLAAGVQPDFVVGASVGAINASYFVDTGIDWSMAGAAMLDAAIPTHVALRGSRRFRPTTCLDAAITEPIARKPKGHDLVVNGRHRRPALARHMTVTGG